MNRKTLATLTAAALALFTLPAQAALRVLACEPEWAALAKELGGELVDATSATSALHAREQPLKMMRRIPHRRSQLLQRHTLLRSIEQL